MNLNLIVAHDIDNGIGLNNTLPWHSPIDLKWFSENTKNSYCIMGSNTYKSILEIRGYEKVLNSNLLPHRKSYVLSSQLENAIGCELIFRNIESFLNYFKHIKGELFIIGGSSIYNQFLPLVKKLYISQVMRKYNCDAFFKYPNMDKFIEIYSQKVYDIKIDTNIIFKIYQKDNREQISWD